MNKKYINAFYVKDKQEDSAMILIPFAKVKFIFVDESAEHYHVISDGIDFHVTKEEYDFYVHYIERR